MQNIKCTVAKVYANDKDSRVDQLMSCDLGVTPWPMGEGHLLTPTSGTTWMQCTSRRPRDQISAIAVDMQQEHHNSNGHPTESLKKEQALRS